MFFQPAGKNEGKLFPTCKVHRQILETFITCIRRTTENICDLQSASIDEYLKYFQPAQPKMYEIFSTRQMNIEHIRLFVTNLHLTVSQ